MAILYTAEGAMFLCLLEHPASALKLSLVLLVHVFFCFGAFDLFLLPLQVLVLLLSLLQLRKDLHSLQLNCLPQVIEPFKLLGVQSGHGQHGNKEFCQVCPCISESFHQIHLKGFVIDFAFVLLVSLPKDIWVLDIDLPLRQYRTLDHGIQGINVEAQVERTRSVGEHCDNVVLCSFWQNCTNLHQNILQLHCQTRLTT